MQVRIRKKYGRRCRIVNEKLAGKSGWCCGPLMAKGGGDSKQVQVNTHLLLENVKRVYFPVELAFEAVYSGKEPPLLCSDGRDKNNPNLWGSCEIRVMVSQRMSIISHMSMKTMVMRLHFLVVSCRIR